MIIKEWYKSKESKEAAKQNFKRKKWECNGKEIKGSKILGSLEEELIYSKKRTAKFLAKQRLQEDTQKEDKNNEEKNEKEDKSAYKEAQIIALVAECYEKYLAEYEYDEKQYEFYKNQLSEYREQKTDIWQLLDEILEKVSSESYLVFRRYLEDYSYGLSLKNDLLYKVYNNSSVTLQLRSYILNVERNFFSYCLKKCDEMIERERLFEYVDFFKVGGGSGTNKGRNKTIENFLTLKKKREIKHILKVKLSESIDKEVKKRKEQSDELLERELRKDKNKKIKEELDKIEEEQTKWKRLMLKIFNISFDEYLNFFEKVIFRDEKMWEAYYRINFETIQFRQQYINDRLRDESNHSGIGENIKKIGIVQFFMPPNEKEDKFEYNFNQSVFFRCVKRLKVELISKADVWGPLNLRSSISFGDSQFNRENKYVTWSNESFYDSSIYQGMLCEILFYKVRKYTIKKKNRNYFEIDEKGGLKVINEDKELYDYIWRVSDSFKNIIKKDYSLKKYYSASFQINIEMNTDLKNLVEKGDCKNYTFGFLIDKMMELQKGTYAYEQYIVEDKTCIMSAWALYECTYELIDCIKTDNKGRDDEESEKIKECIRTLSESVGGIHSLEARCKMIELLKKEIIFCIHNESKRIYSQIMQLNKEVELYKKEFNKIYDLMLEGLWITFDEERWKTLLNFQNVRCESFTRLQRQVEGLVYQKAVNEVSMEKFKKLYQSKSKGERYSWFCMIRTGLKESQ